MNGALIHKKNTLRGHKQGEDVAEASLKKGWNSILMKVTQGTGGWGASMVITNLDHDPVDNLKYKLD